MTAAFHDVMTRRIGLVPGPTDPGPGPSSLGQMLRLLDAVRARHATPLETEALAAVTPGSARELGGFLLGSTFSAAPSIHQVAVEHEGRVALACPFLLGSASQLSLMVWPFDDTSRLQSGGGLAETWVETQVLSRATVESAARKAAALAAERRTQLLWVSAGWGGQEDFALECARAAIDLPMPVLPIEQLQKSVVEPLQGASITLLSAGRTAIPLARWLGGQGWIAWAERGPALAQAWGALGPALSTVFFLDHQGFTAEARSLERITCEVARRGEASTDAIGTIAERILNG